jgi:hypothetical protein
VKNKDLQKGCVYYYLYGEIENELEEKYKIDNRRQQKAVCPTDGK